MREKDIKPKEQVKNFEKEIQVGSSLIFERFLLDDATQINNVIIIT